MSGQVIRHGDQWYNGGYKVCCPECGSKFVEGLVQDSMQWFYGGSTLEDTRKFRCKDCGCLFTMTREDSEATKDKKRITEDGS